MKKKDKRLLLFGIPAAVLCLLLYGYLEMLHVNTAEVLQYPQGTLSDSLFVSQNNVYTENKDLPVTHEFKTLPYMIDVCEAKEATVGGSSIYQMDESTYIYLTEFDKTKGTNEVLLQEFPPALLIDYKPEYTYCQNLQKQTGYVNGFAANYMFHQFSVSNGSIAKTAYIAAYELMDTDDTAANHILVGVVTTQENNLAFQHALSTLDAITSTLRYDDRLAERQQSQQEKALLEEKQAMERAEKESEKEKKQLEQQETISEEPETTSEIPTDTKKMPLPITEQYQNMAVTITYTNAVGAQFFLYAPDGTEITNKTDDGHGTARFFVGKNQIGDYILEYTHYTELGKMGLHVGDYTEE